MPPLPLVPNVIKVAIECQGNDGRLAVNVFHMTYGGGPPSSSDCVNIATQFWDQWVDNFTPTQPAQTSLTKVTVTDLSTDTGGEGEWTNGSTPVPGTSVHGMVPLHSCALLSKFVDKRYRGGHPRSYLPIGTTEDLNDDGDWKASSYGNWITFWTDMLSGVIADNPYGSTNIGEECAVSYVSKIENPVYPYRRAVPEVYDIPIDGGYTMTGQLATQRRRVRKTARRR